MIFSNEKRQNGADSANDLRPCKTCNDNHRSVQHALGLQVISVHVHYAQ